MKIDYLTTLALEPAEMFQSNIFIAHGACVPPGIAEPCRTHVNRTHVNRTLFAPDTVLSALHLVTDLIFTILWGMFYYSCFIDDKAGALDVSSFLCSLQMAWQ